MILGSRHTQVNDPQLHLSLDGKQTEQVGKTKLLGIVLDIKLTWSEHIDYITNKMGKSIALTRKCSKYVVPDTLSQVFQALVSSHLDYCPVIWSTAATKDIRKLLWNAQNKSARIALNCSLHANISKMHRNLSWLPVEN